MVKDTFQFFDYSILTLSFSWSVGLLPFCRTQAFKHLPINLEASFSPAQNQPSQTLNQPSKTLNQLSKFQIALSGSKYTLLSRKLTLSDFNQPSQAFYWPSPLFEMTSCYYFLGLKLVSPSDKFCRKFMTMTITKK